MTDPDLIYPRRSENAGRGMLTHKWVPTLALLVGTLGAYVAWNSDYAAEGTLWIEKQAESGSTAVAPIRGEADSWIELLRSYRVLDQVVSDHELAVGDPRAASRDLSSRIQTVVSRDGSFLRVRLTGSDRQETVAVVNSVMERFVELAAELKGARLELMADVLQEQLEVAGVELTRAERDLEEFRVATLSLPSSRSSPDFAERQQNAERTLAEASLSRSLQGAESVYNDVRRRVESARLAAASSVRDVRILDRATVQRSSGGRRLPLAALIFFACVVAAVGGVLVLDRWDARASFSADDGTVSRLWADVVPVASIVVGGLLTLLALVRFSF